MAGGTDFNPQKFKELLLYLADRSGDDAGFGMTKLNKLLFFCDFKAFRSLGHSITGARYQKLPWGPAALEFLPLLEELVSEQRARVETHPRGDYEQRRTVSTGANTSVFTTEELALIDSILDELRQLDATSVSNLSHEQSAGWNLVEERDLIPYETALVSMRHPSAAMFAHAERLAKERNWSEVRP